MIDLTPYAHCVCKRMNNKYDLCDGELGFSEMGKKVKFTVSKPTEEAVAMVLDGCLFKDADLKCDGLFLYRSPNKKAAFLVELKGAGDIAHAFKQLAHVKNSRPEYKDLLERLRTSGGPGKVFEKGFIVSSGMLTRPQIRQLEDQHGIRVAAVLHSEPTKPVPDLRDYL